jgi:anti-sigma-K factor RskA
MTRKDDASLSGAYALHALDADEAKAFEAHIAESEASRNEATELADTAVLLGLAVAPETPPASLKASIMAQLGSTPQLDREPAAETSADARFSGRAEAKAQARWFQRPVNAIIGVAAAVALIIGGGVAVNAISTNVTQSAAANQLAAIQSASDSQSLKGTVAGGGEATLVYAASLKSSALIVNGMNALPADKVYELWYIDDKGARPAGTFTVGPDGTMWQVLEGEMNHGDTVGVTVEPHGGSTTPTTDPVLVLASA